MPSRTEETLSAVINVRCTEHEKTHLRMQADAAGLPLSEYVRRRVLGRVVIASTDASVLRELRRLGGLLKHVHTSSSGVYSLETAAALKALQGYAESLTRGVHDSKEDQAVERG